MEELGLNAQQLEFIKHYEELLKNHVKPGENPRLQALLDLAIHRGTIEQLRKVLATGANPNFVYINGQTPLGLVIHWRREDRGAAEFMRELVRAGADPTLPSEHESLITKAAFHGNTQWAINVLLELTPKTKLKTEDLNYALRMSAHDPARVKKLLDAGALPDAVGRVNNGLIPAAKVSALMLASFFATLQSVEVLLAAGASVNLCDGEGHTALDYASFDAKRCRQVIRRLEAAGAISGKSFGQARKKNTGFSAVAKKPEFRKAVAKVQELTGIKPTSIQNQEDKIAGASGFLFKTAGGKMDLEAQLTADAMAEQSAKQFAEQHQAELLTDKALLIYSRDLCAKRGNLVALFPTTDIYAVIAAIGTEGPNSNVSTGDLIAWLRALEKEQPFSVVGIGADFIEGKFTTPIRDAKALVKRINKLCPDGDDGEESDIQQASILNKTGRLFLWWD